MYLSSFNCTMRRSDKSYSPAPRDKAFCRANKPVLVRHFYNTTIPVLFWALISVWKSRLRYWAHDSNTHAQRAKFTVPCHQKLTTRQCLDELDEIICDWFLKYFNENSTNLSCVRAMIWYECGIVFSLKCLPSLAYRKMKNVLCFWVVQAKNGGV